MKKLKKIMSFVVAFMMVVSLMIIPDIKANAAGDKKLTIKDATHTYEAYQVFSGNLNTVTKEMGSIAWGTGVDGAALFTELKSSTTATAFGGVNPFATCNNAGDVAKVLADDPRFITSGVKDKNLAIFANIVAKHFTTTSTPGDKNGSITEIKGLEEGYYIVKDTFNVSGKNESKSRFMLQITDDTQIDIKPVKPTIEKNIIDGSGNKIKANTASIGDKITYQLDSVVPDMTGYNKYFFVVNDRLSKGLSFNNDVTVTIDGAVLDVNNYVVTATGSDPTEIKIVFKDFINQQVKAGKPIAIKYSATLNNKAVIGNVGNPNEVDLKYSNDPTHKYIGTNEPDSSEPTGITPPSRVITYTFKLELTKVDGSTAAKLTDAKFSIAGIASNITMISGKVFEKGTTSEHKYYKLTDGSYTLVAPGDPSKYDSTTDKYKEVSFVDKTTVPTNITKEGYVDKTTSIITFDELGEGTFTISELKAPAGYNKVPDFDVVIKADWTNPSVPVFKASVAGGSDATIGDDGVIRYDVKNNQGVVLPSTGGIGTTIFYVVGGIMVLAAVVLLITKKRMDKE